MIKESIKKFLKEPSVKYYEDHPEFGHHVYANDTGVLYTGTTTISGAWRKDFLAPWYSKEAVKALGWYDEKEVKKDDRLDAKLLFEQKFEALKNLSSTDYFNILGDAKGAARVIGDRAKENGTLAHAWMASAICSKFSDTKILPKPKEPEALNAVNAFIKWHDENRKKIEWLASEELVCSDAYKIAGTLDALLNYDSILTIGDLKTSSQISEDYILQLAGYDIQLAEMGLQAKQWLIIRTPKDGSEVDTLTINDPKLMQFAREAFLHQREAHKFYVFAENHMKGGEGFIRKMMVDEKSKVEKPKVKKTVKKIIKNKNVKKDNA